MTYKTIIYEKKEKLAYLTLNRPQNGNAVNAQMAEELASVCQVINGDEEVMVVLLLAAGDSFCTGSDPGALEASARASDAIASLERVALAAINGDALGEGLELALSCDIRVASEKALLGLPQTSHGLIPAGGGTQRLPHLVGKGKAMELILLGEVIDAQEAYRIGLVNKVVPPDQLLPAVEEMTSKIIPMAPIALRYAKEAVNKGLDLTLAQGMRLEADLYFLIQTTDDRMEGIRSFMEKRPPQFKGG